MKFRVPGATNFKTFQGVCDATPFGAGGVYAEIANKVRHFRIISAPHCVQGFGRLGVVDDELRLVFVDLKLLYREQVLKFTRDRQGLGCSNFRVCEISTVISSAKGQHHSPGSAEMA